MIPGVEFILDYCLYNNEDVIVIYGADFDTVSGAYDCMRSIMEKNRTFYDYSYMRGDEAKLEKWKCRNQSYYHDEHKGSVIVYFTSKLSQNDCLKLITTTQYLYLQEIEAKGALCNVIL